MSNNKQSSLEQFAIALYDNGLLQGNGDQINDLLEKHKAIHKEEIRLIYEGLLQNVGTSIKQDDLPIFEQYYNETYGGNKWKYKNK